MEQPTEVRKAIIPIAGLGTRFLPLSLAVPKEFFPLADKPSIQFIVEEMKKSGIKEIVFVVSPRQKRALEYFKKSPDLEKTLIARKKESALKDLKDFEASFEGISFSFVTQSKPHGDGHAILQAAKKIKDEPVANSFGDDVMYGDEPATAQLMEIFKTTNNAPVIGLAQLPKEKIPAYGMVIGEKIANRVYRIKKIVEKPHPTEITSNLVVVGRHILTPDVFEYLKKAKPGNHGEIILSQVFDQMLADGKPIYGYELKGEWLECGDKLKWIKSFLYVALKDERFAKEIQQYIKTIK